MNIYYAVTFFILGSVLASFYGVVATRLPEEKSILGRSHCLYCNHTLSWFELIPVFSFLFLRGKCKNCKKKLPVYEPLMELSCGILFSLSYLYYGFSYSFWVSLILISLLFIIFVSDFRYMIILDSPLVLSSLLIFGLKWFYYGLSSALWSLLDGAILFFIFYLIGYFGSKLFSREALGGGDIKLAFVMGLLLGVPHAIMALVLSTFLALPYATYSLFSTKEREVPFGPFLISALFIVFLFLDKFSSILNLFKF